MKLRSDTLAVCLGMGVIVAGGIASDASQRQWSSLLTVACVIGLIWRGVSTLPDLSHLARALLTVLAINLACAAAAQLLLIQQVERLPQGVPNVNNTLGVSLVMGSRILILIVIAFWPRWLNRWEWPHHARRRNV